MYAAVRRLKDGPKGGGEGERKSYFVAADAPMFYARIPQRWQKKTSPELCSYSAATLDKRREVTSSC